MKAIILSTLLAIALAGSKGWSSDNKNNSPYNSGGDDQYSYYYQDQNNGPYSGADKSSYNSPNQNSNYSPYNGQNNQGSYYDPNNQGSYYDSNNQGSYYDSNNQGSYYDPNNQGSYYDSNNQGSYYGPNNQGSYYDSNNHQNKQGSNYSPYGKNDNSNKNNYPSSYSYNNNYQSQCPFTTTTLFVTPTSGEGTMSCEFVLLNCGPDKTAEVSIAINGESAKRAISVWSSTTIVGTAEYYCNKDGVISLSGFFIADGYVFILNENFYPDWTVSGTVSICKCKKFDASSAQCTSPELTEAFTGTYTQINSGFSQFGGNGIHGGSNGGAGKNGHRASISADSTSDPSASDPTDPSASDPTDPDSSDDVPSKSSSDPSKKNNSR